MKKLNLNKNVVCSIRTYDLDQIRGGIMNTNKQECVLENQEFDAKQKKTIKDKQGDQDKNTPKKSIGKLCYTTVRFSFPC